MKKWYVRKLLSLWSCELPHVVPLFVSVTSDMIVILQFFVLLKVSTTWLKWFSYSSFFTFLIMLHSFFCVDVLKLLSFWSHKTRFRWIFSCYSSSFTIFIGFSDCVIVILSFLTLLRTSLVTCFRWAPLSHLAFVVVSPCWSKKP
jgi:hypothetical protein